MAKYFIFFVVAAAVLVACTGGSPSETAASFATPIANEIALHEHEDGHEHVHVDELAATAALEVALVASELVVGPNRFAVGLFDGEGQVVHDAGVHFHYYDVSDPAAPALEMEADATAIHTPDGLTTIFVHERDFGRAGDWGVEVQARFPDGSAALKRIGFEVLADSPTLKPGEMAPPLKTPALAAVGNDLSRLTSAAAPNPALHELSLAEALSNGKPTALLFATPAFCRTRFCGPAYEQVSQLEGRFGESVNFVQVEVYTGLPDPATNNWEIAPAMSAFGLATEPWLYLIGDDGRVFYRVEGVFGVDEVARQLEAVGSDSEQ